MIENVNVFDPSTLSFPDCDFLLAHAGEAPVVALQSLPAAANRVTVLGWIGRFYELDELAKVGRGTWKGVAEVKAAIQVYLEQRKKWAKQTELGAPKFPSLYAFDSRGKGHYQAPGSDSGRVRTYFDEQGNRHPFAMNLIGDGEQGWQPEWINKTTAVSVDRVIEDATARTIRCSICQHTETYKLESRSSRAAARARMSKHLRRPQEEPARHSELHTLEFGS